MTQLQKENIDLLVKLKQVKKRYNDKLEKEITNFWNKWAIRIGGGFFLFGIAVGKLG